MSPVVPIEEFGRDHWSTFLYAETCVVDGVGRIDPRRMRNKDGAGARYPTRTKTGEVANHDDYDCLRDLAMAGLIDVEFGSQGDARVALTDYGWQVVGALRRWRATSEGHRIDGFTPATVPANLDESRLEVLMRSIAIYCDERADIERVLARLMVQDWDGFWKEWADNGEVAAAEPLRHPQPYFVPRWVVEAVAQGLRSSPVTKTVAYLTRDHLLLALHSDNRVYEVGITIKQVDGPELADEDAEVAPGWMSNAAFAVLAGDLEEQGYAVEMGHAPVDFFAAGEHPDCPHCHSSLFLYEFRDTRGDGAARPLLRHFLMCVECGAAKEVSR